MDGQTPTSPNVSRTQQTPVESLASSPISPNEMPEGKRSSVPDGTGHSPVPNGTGKGLLFGIVFVIIVLVLVFGILNYLNILKLSEIFPNYLGFLPRKEATDGKSQREVPTGTSQQSNNLTTAPNEQAKQILTNFLPTILTPSFLPKSPFDISLTEDKEDKEKLNAAWNIEGGGTTWAVFPNPSNSKKITSLDVFFEKIQTASPSVEVAKSGINQIFSSSPKGEWNCSKDPLNERKLYCENFWEGEGSKKGVGFTIVNTSQFRGRLIYSFCEHSKESNLYAWKSCRSEFAETGVK